jgi:putative ABC transport system substrate-binding protein
MKRREFITLIGGAAAWPLAARAQQVGKLPTIGVLGAATPSTMSSRLAAFVQRLRELGWIENRNVAIEYRWAELRSERYDEIAAEFTRLKVDVIVTSGTPAVIAIKQATAVIPIIFVTVADPVGSGLVASLARPGGNVTGLSLQSPDIAGKRLALLREVVPNLRRVAFMGNVDNPVVPPEMREMQAAAGTLGLEATAFEIRRTQDIVPAFEALKHRAEALYLASEGVVDANRLRINILALGARLPTMWSQQSRSIRPQRAPRQMS